MRKISKQAKLALGLSLVAHAVLLLALFQFFALIQAAPSLAERDIVDRRIEAPTDYPPMSINLEDLPAPSPKAEPKTLPRTITAPTQPAAPPQTPTTSSTSEKPASEKVTPASATGGNERTTGQSASVSPLHGPLTKAGMSIVYVLDRSGSMGRERKLFHAAAMLKESLGQLGPDILFQIVLYDSQAVIARIGGSCDLAPASPQNIREAQTQLSDLIGEGSSRHFEGLQVGLGLHPDLLLLLTDADELGLNEVKRLKLFNNKGTIIHAVLLGSADASMRSSLRDLAGVGNVHWVAPPDIAGSQR